MMKLKPTQGLIFPNESVNMRDLHNSFMALFRKWADLKAKYNKTQRENIGVAKWKEFNNDVTKIRLQMTKWTSDIEQHKASNSVLSYFAKTADASNSTTDLSPTVTSSATTTASTAASSSDTTASTAASSSSTAASSSATTSSTAASSSATTSSTATSSSAATITEKPKPAQEACVKKIEDLKSEYDYIKKKNFKSAEDLAKEKLLKKSIKAEELKLNRLKSDAQSAKARRVKLKAKRQLHAQPHKNALVRPGTIEDRLISDGIEISLQDAIIELVTHGAAAEQKRQADMIQSCTTLNSLKENLLKEFNIKISRSTLYTRVLPRDSRTIEGRRHFSCAPVRLLKPQNNLMKEHQDGHFAAATVKHMKDLAQLLGPKAVFFLSQDDKARIALGLPAVQNQTRVAMHVQYRIKLPDHDWMVAAKHKLIPSVYASCVAGADGSVGYNGSTYIAIRSGKHDHSGADTHLQDFHRLFELKEFEKEMKDDNGELKPILLVTVDGGPDENPRFPKTLTAWSSVFIQYNLDMLIVATHAPGQSAYNAVERRMAPLSKSLSGVILPYDTYGSHLNSSHKTVDEALELKNFQAAGQVLSEIWGEMSIANYPVSAEFIPPDAEKPMLNERPEKWIHDHVLQTQYCLQISKCTNSNCCDSPKTSIFKLLNGRFIPSPVPFTFDCTGPTVDEKNGHYGSLTNRLLCDSIISKDIVFDAFCPSVKKDLKSRTCDECGKYFATKKAKLSHRKSQVCTVAGDYLLDSESEKESGDEEMEEDNNEPGGLPVIDVSSDPFAYINVFENLTI